MPVTGFTVISAEPGVMVGALKLNIVPAPTVRRTLVTTGASNSTPRNSGWLVGPGGTKNRPRLVLPAKYSMLLVFADSTSRKMAPKPRVAAATGAVPRALASTKLTTIVLLLNEPKIRVGLKNGNWPTTP